MYLCTLKQGRDFTGEVEAGAHGYTYRQAGGTQDQTRMLHIYLHVEGTKVHDCEISQLWSM